MLGPARSVDAVVALLLASAAYCAVRATIVLMARRGERCDIHISHAVMATVMAGMFLNVVNLGPRALWAGIFVGFAAWFGWRSAIALREAPHTWRIVHESNHVVTSGAMVAMFASGTMLHGGTMSAMTSTPGQPAWFLPTAVLMGAVLIWYALLNASMLLGVASPAGSTKETNVSEHGVGARRLIAELRVSRCCDVVMAGSMVYMFALVR